MRKARMRILLHHFNTVFHVERTAEARCQFCLTALIKSTSLPQCPIGFQKLAVLPGEGIEVRTSDFLFAFKDPLDADREFVIRSQNCPYSTDAGNEFGF